MRGASIQLLAAQLLAALCIAACSGETGEGAPASEDAVAVNVEADPVEDGEISIDLWLEQLEVGSRELYSAREAVLDAVDLPEGARIADIGAGTGLYTLLFADAVGRSGHVYAIDIEPLFLDLINQRAADAGFDNVTAVFGRDNDITLPAQSVDVVFIADTYHYFNDREAIMRTVYDALKPGGALVMVEYDIVQGQRRPEGKDHVRFGKAAVVAEVEYAGFEKVGELDVAGLTDNYFVRFRKPE